MKLKKKIYYVGFNLFASEYESMVWSLNLYKLLGQSLIIGIYT